MARRVRVRVEGAGLAALCAARLLCRRSFEVRLDRAQAGPGRVAAVPAATIALLCDIWDARVGALTPGVPVQSRRVAWEAGAPALVDHPALVLDTGALCTALARLLPEETLRADAAEADWTIRADGSRGGPRLGLRHAVFAHAEAAAARGETRVSAVAGAWLFSAPHPAGGTLILACAPEKTALTDCAERLRGWLAEAGLEGAARSLGAVGAPAPVAPRYQPASQSARALPAGDALIALDPLRGDGTGHAARGALLAQACIGAVEDGGDPERIHAHFRERMRAVWVSHLTGCAEAYARARGAPYWAGEIAAMRGALAAENDFAPFNYELRGRGLEAR